MPKCIAKIVAGEKESFPSSKVRTLGYAVNNATRNTSNILTTKTSISKRQSTSLQLTNYRESTKKRRSNMKRKKVK